MRGRFVLMVAIMVMLSACAGTSRQDLAVADPEPGNTTARHLEHADHDGDGRSTYDRASRLYHREPVHHHDHHDHGSSYDEVYAGQIALLLSAQVFTCAFFVVILDGSCNFYASTGYYY